VSAGARPTHRRDPRCSERSSSGAVSFPIGHRTLVSVRMVWQCHAVPRVGQLIWSVCLISEEFSEMPFKSRNDLNG